MNAKPRARYIRLSPDDRRLLLIEAAIACIAEGGISAFTVDRICVKAEVSRGLITHHFGSMDALLTEVYSHIYATSVPNPSDLPSDRPAILALLDHFFSPALFNRQALNIWLTLWAEISNHPTLRAEHRAQYAAYVGTVTDALRAAAPTLPNAPTVALWLICLVDGLGLQHCIDPDSMPADTARAACIDLLTPHLGPLT